MRSCYCIQKNFFKKSILFSFFWAFGFSQLLLAKPAKVLNQGSLVYESPDFDSEVLGELDVDDTIEVSIKKFGPFHRIQLSKKEFGYIADSDFVFADGTSPIINLQKQGEQQKAIPHKSEKIVQQLKDRPKKKYSLHGTQFWGRFISMINYRESTMGMQPTQKSFFWGVKFSGPDFFIEGDTHTEMNIQLRSTAPEFYQQATGIGTTGWIFLPDFLIQYVQPQSKNLMTSYGYGAMFRYSKYIVGLNNGASGINYYSLEDMVIGAVANAGFHYRMGGLTLRTEAKLYVEKMTYWGIGLTLLFPF